MEKKEEAVDQKDQKAATDQQEVKKEDSGASAEQQDDLSAQLAAKDAELKKLAEERDNYKKGLLKAKGKIDDEGDDDQQSDDMDSKIQSAVREALYSETEKKLQAEKDALLQKALLENKELKTALANKSGMTTTKTEGSSDDRTTTPQFFSPEQIKELKGRGFTDEMIKKAAENMQARR